MSSVGATGQAVPSCSGVASRTEEWGDAVDGTSEGETAFLCLSLSDASGRMMSQSCSDLTDTCVFVFRYV